MSGAIGRLGFLTFLGRGYLDTWHGILPLFLAPVFVAGLWRSKPFLTRRDGKPTDNDNVFATWGRRLLLFCAAGLALASATIAVFGKTRVFVPSDLAFIGLDPTMLEQISPLLIPLISHDRAGFGAALCALGAFLLIVIRHAEITRSLVEIIALMGAIGFGCAGVAL